MKRTILFTIASSALCAASYAAVIATPSYDSDSYLAFKTNNPTSDQITITASQQGAPQYHFLFAAIEFDVSSLATSGDKFLRINPVDYVTGQPGSQTHSTTGTATVKLVALTHNWADYQASGNAQTWYDTHVQNGSVPVVGTFNLVDLQAGYVDVTSTLNGWINDGSTNKGFALFSTSGNVELAAMNNANSSLSPALVDSVSSVPEPSSAALLGLGGVALIFRRRK